MKLIKLWEADLDKAYALHQTFEQDENGFMNSAYGLSFEEFKDYVKTRENHSQGIGLPEGYVSDTVYILEDQQQYVGIFNFRHSLNDFLREGAGHISYGISKEYRGQGYASNGLKLLIDLIKDDLIEDEIYMSVCKYNTASLKTQLKNGAYIHHEDDQHYYTRIKI